MLEGTGIVQEVTVVLQVMILDEGIADEINFIVESSQVLESFRISKDEKLKRQSECWSIFLFNKQGATHIGNPFKGGIKC